MAYGTDKKTKVTHWQNGQTIGMSRVYSTLHNTNKPDQITKK